MPRSDQDASTVSLRVDELIDRYGLSGAAAEQLARLVDLVASDPLAPTAVRDPARVVDDHLADSLVALELTEVQQAASIADLGSGPGFPGLALALALAGAEVALVESNARKCAFIERAIAILGARNARAFNVRAESWGEGLRSFELVTARALAPLDVVAEYAAPLLRMGGTLVVWRGRRDPDAERSAAAAAAQLGLQATSARTGRAVPRRRASASTPHVEGDGDPGRLPEEAGSRPQAPTRSQT